jgi:lipopolysaccharide transport system ATP-binding protein
VAETIIQVENLSKRYRLGTIGTGTLSHDLKRWWQRRRGKEDQYQRIDEKDLNGEYWALRGISFEIKQGAIVGIIGRNGAGKSTLLKILSRVTSPTRGVVRIDGRIASLLEVGTGFHPELTGRENIFMNGAILGMTKSEIRSKMDEIIEFSGIATYIDTPVKRYSSGMYVRLAFAVAAHLEPEILIVDEVLAVGDVDFQKKCLGKMQDVSKNQGRTVLFVSHDMQAVSTLTTECIFLQKGSIKAYAKTNDVINQYIDSDKTHNSYYQDFTPADKPKIAQIRLITSLPNNVQTNGEQFVVEITITVPFAIKGACLYFYIVDSKERNYAHLWAFDADLPHCKEPGSHIIRCIIPKLRLYMGKYYLKVFFSEPAGGQFFQFLENICPFEVVLYGNYREMPWQPGACAYLEESAWEVVSESLLLK